MIRSDEDWLSVVDLFHAAAVGEESWDVALQGFADATESRSAQLVAIDSHSSVVLDMLTNVDPALFKVFAETTTINPRVKVCNEAPLLKVLADMDFMTPNQYERDTFCQEVARPWDVPYICMTTLERQEGTFVALAAVRSHRDGHISEGGRRVFAAIAPHARAAVRTHVALQGHGVAVLTKSMDTLSIPLFVCDRSGRVVTLTAAAEALVEQGSALQLKAGKLYAAQPLDTQMLNDAIEAAALSGRKPGSPASRTAIVHRQHSEGAPVVLDIFALPSQSTLPALGALVPRVVVVVRRPTGAGAHRAAILSALYGLTSAEVEIALQLADGKTADAIAAQRRVAVGTVRAQIKAILAKVGVRRQVELIVRLNQL